MEIIPLKMESLVINGMASKEEIMKIHTETQNKLNEIDKNYQDHPDLLSDLQGRKKVLQEYLEVLQESDKKLNKILEGRKKKEG